MADRATTKAAAHEVESSTTKGAASHGPAAGALGAAGDAALSRMAGGGAHGGFAHPWMAKVAEALGLATGVAVTEALRLAPSWNEPVLDGNGRPVESVPGAERIGGHDILKRHEAVVGPKIAALDHLVPAGIAREIVDGFAQGATEAPGVSYRLDAKLDDAMGGGKTGG